MPEVFAEVILPLSLHTTFTYKVPSFLECKIQAGQCVIVQFGAKKFYTALVVSLSEKKPEYVNVKEVVQILYESPIVLPRNMELWRWIARYYCCTLGDIFRVALPSGLKLEHQSKIIPTELYSIDNLSKRELFFIKNINNITSVAELQKKLKNEFSYSTLKSLFKKGLIQIEEKIDIRYKPKTETFVKFHPDIINGEIINETIEKLGRSKKQQAFLIHFCNATRAFKPGHKDSIAQNELFSKNDFNLSILKELVKKNILTRFQKNVLHIKEDEPEQINLNLLNPYQEKALVEIKKSFCEKHVTLIHGITASGKTEIYMHLIDEILKSGKQALYLVPEISLTTQIIRRLKNVFGNKVGVYHSKLNSHERVEVWEKVLQFQTEQKKGYQIILGTRSAVFLPFSNLGIIIVDEEHENSFKQFDPAPRYNARDIAIVMSLQNNAKVLLGSATPSFESYYNATTGKYGLVNLNKRHSEVEPPKILIADVKRTYKRKEMHSVLTPELFELTEKALNNNEQVIFFQNRRGYSPFVECFTCGWIPKCKNCDVSLTYHKYKNRLTCHYCGFSSTFSGTCDNCGLPEIKAYGFGTEKIEDELKPVFPNARIARMDLDTTHTKNALDKIIHNIEHKNTDILIGTQMITKGLDFEHVNLVGILNADNMLNFPDFRAHERAFQLILQVSGRAGRRQNRGKVVIQTSQPKHPLIQAIQTQDYVKIFNMLIEERKLFNYPPFFRLIKIVMKHKNIDILTKASEHLASMLKKNDSFILLGPEFPLINKIKLWYNMEIWLKIDRNKKLDELKQFIIQCVMKTKKEPNNNACVINIDVDPL
ncbi:MAG: primosomal protein N' [Bacteroidales bacterium]|jgi:primosomal protein N' (replication factor Y)|nr:primosomal protein N' [Bacteroidales bacterium]